MYLLILFIVSRTVGIFSFEEFFQMLTEERGADGVNWRQARAAGSSYVFGLKSHFEVVKKKS